MFLFSHWVKSDSLRPHGPQHARPFCPSPSPEDCPSSCPLYQWSHPAVSSSDVLFSFYPPSFPASGTFPMSHLFASNDQNTRASALACSSNEYSALISLKIDWFDLLDVQGTFRSLKASILWCSAFFMVQFSVICDHWEDHSLEYNGLLSEE